MAQTLTETAICTNALYMLGESHITSLLDDSLRARVCNSNFGAARDQCLQDMRPNFAKSYKTLAQAVTAPLFEWDARYPLPADYLSLICTYPDKIEFEIVETDLYCNEAAMSIKYIKRVTDTTKWTPLFADAVTYKLAERIAPALKDAAREGMTTMYQESRRLTKADTGLETGSKPIMADDFIDVRYIN